jgi:protein-L-isoaspartate(D-aspartate) O-methyltransferase
MPEDRKYQRQRRQLVDHLRANDISDERVLSAIGAVPRHAFVDPALRARAYEDEALPIGMNQTISQPFTVAYQTMLLDPQVGDRVLEIGTGSGYQAAVLAEMGAHVFSIERHKALLERTRAILKSLNYRVVLKHGDGTLGWLAYAPYGGIIVTAGASDVPVPLLEQLRIAGEEGKPAGRLVIPIGDASGQKMNRFRRIAEDDYEREEAHIFRFVPLVGREGGL